VLASLFVLPLQHEQVADVASAGGRVGMFSAQHIVEDLRGPLIHRQRLLVLAERHEHESQVVERHRNIGMARTQRRLRDPQRPLVMFPRRLVLALISQQVAQIAQMRRQLRMLHAQGLLPGPQPAFEIPPGLRLVPNRVVGKPYLGEGDGHPRMVRAEGRLEHLQRWLEVAPRLPVVPSGVHHLPQILQADRHVDWVTAAPGMGECHASPLRAAYVLGSMVANDRREPLGGGQRHVVEVVLDRRFIGCLEVAFRRVVVPRRTVEPSPLGHGLDHQGLVTESLRPLHDRLDLVERRHESTRALGGPDVRQLLAQGFRRLPKLGVFGQRHDGPQRVQIVAPGQRRQVGHQTNRTVHDLGVRPGQLVHRRPQSAGPFLHAVQPQASVELGLLIGGARLAHLGVFVRPRIRVVVQTPLHSLPCGGRMPQIRTEDGPRDLFAPRVVPDVGQVTKRIAATRRRECAAPQHDPPAEPQRPQDDAERQPTTRPGSHHSLQLVEQRPHRRPAIVRLGREPSEHDLTQLRRDPSAGGR